MLQGHIEYTPNPTQYTLMPYLLNLLHKKDYMIWQYSTSMSYCSIQLYAWVNCMYAQHTEQSANLSNDHMHTRTNDPND